MRIRTATLGVILASALIACSSPEPGPDSAAPTGGPAQISSGEVPTQPSTSTGSSPTSDVGGIDPSQLSAAIDDTATVAPAAGCAVLVDINKAASELLLAHADGTPYTQEQADAVYASADQVPEQYRDHMNATRKMLNDLVGQPYKLDDQRLASINTALLKDLKASLACS